MDAHATTIQNAIRTPNEVRTIENMEPMENGDDLMIQGATVSINSQSGEGGGGINMNDYGVAIRSGILTPQVEDEQDLRSKLQLPELSQSAKSLWSAQEGTRTPVTLKSGKEGKADAEQSSVVSSDQNNGDQDG